MSLYYEEFFKTFVVQNFGLIINNKAIPVDSTSTVACSDTGKDEIDLKWLFPDKKEEHTIISFEEFEKLIENGYIKDINLIKKPKTQPLYKKGDLVEIYENEACKACTSREIGDEGVVDSSRYNWETQEWIYEIFNIGNNFNKTFEPNCYHSAFEEKYLKKAEKVSSVVKFNDKKYLLSIEKKLRVI